MRETFIRFQIIYIRGITCQKSTILLGSADSNPGKRHVRRVVRQHNGPLGFKRDIALSERNVLRDHLGPSMGCRDGGKSKSFRSSVFDSRLCFKEVQREAQPSWEKGGWELVQQLDCAAAQQWGSKHSQQEQYPLERARPA